MDKVTAILGAYLKFLEDELVNTEDGSEYKAQLMKDAMDVRKAIRMWRWRDCYEFNREKWRKTYVEVEE